MKRIKYVVLLILLSTTIVYAEEQTWSKLESDIDEGTTQIFNWYNNNIGNIDDYLQEQIIAKYMETAQIFRSNNATEINGEEYTKEQFQVVSNQLGYVDENNISENQKIIIYNWFNDNIENIENYRKEIIIAKYFENHNSINVNGTNYIIDQFQSYNNEITYVEDNNITVIEKETETEKEQSTDTSTSNTTKKEEKKLSLTNYLVIISCSLIIIVCAILPTIIKK